MNQQVLTRLHQEYKLCTEDVELINIGCNFGLENNDIFKWRITMVGPRNTPYEGGLFTILAKFPPDYPIHGPEFKFMNKIYHLNVDFQNNLGHICINSINEWEKTGRVKGNPFYTVKQALFDIFCLFFYSGLEEAHEGVDARTRITPPEKFYEEAKRWTKEFASMF